MCTAKNENSPGENTAELGDLTITAVACSMKLTYDVVSSLTVLNEVLCLDYIAV